jgi:hypothetical protein
VIRAAFSGQAIMAARSLLKLSSKRGANWRYRSRNGRPATGWNIVVDEVNVLFRSDTG